MAKSIEQFSLRRLFIVVTTGIVVWGLLWLLGDCLYSNKLPLPLTQFLLIPHWFLFIGTPFVAGGILINRVGWGIAVGVLIALILLLLPLLPVIY